MKFLIISSLLFVTVYLCRSQEVVPQIADQQQNEKNDDVLDDDQFEAELTEQIKDNYFVDSKNESLTFKSIIINVATDLISKATAKIQSLRAKNKTTEVEQFSKLQTTIGELVAKLKKTIGRNNALYLEQKIMKAEIRLYELLRVTKE